MSKEKFKRIYGDSKAIAKFSEVFSEEFSSTLEGLIGEKYIIEASKNEKVSKNTKLKDNLISTVVEIRTNYQGLHPDIIGKALVLIPAGTALMLGDMTLGGEGDVESNEVSLEDLDCTKEIVSNVVVAMSTTLGKQEVLPSFTLKTQECTYISSESKLEDSNYKSSIYLSDYSRCLTYSIKSLGSNIYFLIDSSIEEELKEHSYIETPVEDAPRISEDDGENGALLDDVEVKVTVLVGSTILTLQEIKNLKDNSTIELSQLANDPLILCVNNIPYAEGEAVVIDGMYGIQITRLFTRKEVYHA